MRRNLQTYPNSVALEELKQRILCMTGHFVMFIAVTPDSYRLISKGKKAAERKDALK